MNKSKADESVDTLQYENIEMHRVNDVFRERISRNRTGRPPYITDAIASVIRATELNLHAFESQYQPPAKVRLLHCCFSLSKNACVLGNRNRAFPHKRSSARTDSTSEGKFGAQSI